MNINNNNQLATRVRCNKMVNTLALVPVHTEPRLNRGSRVQLPVIKRHKKHKSRVRNYSLARVKKIAGVSPRGLCVHRRVIGECLQSAWCKSATATISIAPVYDGEIFRFECSIKRRLTEHITKTHTHAIRPPHNVQTAA